MEGDPKLCKLKEIREEGREGGREKRIPYVDESKWTCGNRMESEGEWG